MQPTHLLPACCRHQRARQARCTCLGQEHGLNQVSAASGEQSSRHTQQGSASPRLPRSLPAGDDVIAQKVICRGNKAESGR